MTSVRRWSARRLLTAWMVIPAGAFLFRWAVLVGGEAVANLPRSFGTVSLWVTAAGTLLVLGSMTVRWFIGRKERHVAKVMNLRASQRIVR